MREGGREGGGVREGGRGRRGEGRREGGRGRRGEGRGGGEVSEHYVHLHTQEQPIFVHCTAGQNYHTEQVC